MMTSDLSKLGDPFVCFESVASSHVPLAPAVSQGVMSFGASLPELVPVVINNRCRTIFQAPIFTSTELTKRVPGGASSRSGRFSEGQNSLRGVTESGCLAVPRADVLKYVNSKTVYQLFIH